MVADGTQHVVVIPVKPPGVGKTRLVGVPAEQRVALASAFAIDTVTACLATAGVAQVLVTTDDARFAATLTALGAEACPDGGSGLNQALVQAAAEAARRWPGLRPVALCADLPALRAEDLTLGTGVRHRPDVVRRRCRRHRHHPLHRAVRRLRAAVRCRLGGCARGGRRGSARGSAARAAAGRRRPRQPSGRDRARSRNSDPARSRRGRPHGSRQKQRRAALVVRTARRG